MAHQSVTYQRSTSASVRHKKTYWKLPSKCCSGVNLESLKKMETNLNSCKSSLYSYYRKKYNYNARTMTYTFPTNDECIELFKQGNYKELLDSCGLMVLKMVSTTQAESKQMDIFQTLMLDMMSAIPYWKPSQGTPFLAYMKTIMHNSFCHYLRATANEREIQSKCDLTDDFSLFHAPVTPDKRPSFLPTIIRWVSDSTIPKCSKSALIQGIQTPNASSLPPNVQYLYYKTLRDLRDGKYPEFTSKLKTLLCEL